MKLKQKLYIVSLIFALAIPVCAANMNLGLYVNNSIIHQTNALGQAYVVPSTNRTMVPTRLVSESLGFDVKWDNNTKTATVSNGTDTVILKLNQNTATVNGVTKTLDAPVESKNDRIYVPLRFVGEALGCTVDYNSANKAVYITTGGNVSKPSTPSTGFVGIGNMVAGQEYKLDQLVTNRNEKYESLKVIIKKELRWDTNTIIVKKGTLGDSVTGLTVKSFGWDCEEPLGGAFEYTGSPAYDPRVIFFKGNEILRIEKCHSQYSKGGKTYYLFGDALNRTSKDMLDATHIGFAVPYQGEILIVQKQSSVPTLNIYK